MRKIDKSRIQVTKERRKHIHRYIQTLSSRGTLCQIHSSSDIRVCELLMHTNVCVCVCSRHQKAGAVPSPDGSPRDVGFNTREEICQRCLSHSNS